MLERRPLGESDEIVALLSPQRGRFDAVARGSRKASSVWVARVEPFTLLSGQFAAGRKDLDYFNQARVIKAFGGLRQSLDKMVYGSYVLKLVRDGLEQGESIPEFFRLLLAWLSHLEEHEPGPTLVRWFELRLARQLGVEPELDRCAGCGQSGLVGFSPVAGGAVCRHCLDRASLRVAPGALAALRYLGRSSLEAATRLRLSADDASGLEAALTAHLGEHWPSGRRFPQLSKELLS